MESTAARLTTHRLAAGEGWRIEHVCCRLGPDAPAATEWHDRHSVSLVLDGLFQYEGERGAALLAPGALLLGNAGAAYRCSHPHGSGDRCVSCQFDAQLLAEIGATRSGPPFRRTRIAPHADTLVLHCEARELSAGADPAFAEELALEFLTRALERQTGAADPPLPARTRAAVARTVRRISQEPAAPHCLQSLAALAAMSRHAYVRAFRKMAGITPYQYLLRCRLVDAAQRLRHGNAPVTQVAAEAGFGDLSEFTRRFRRHFGRAPGTWREAVSVRRPR